MASQHNALLICVGLGVIGFVIGMGYLIYGAIAYREPNLIGIVIGMGSMIGFPLIGMFIEMRRDKTHGTSGVRDISPTMRYESGTPNYCPLCHANLGANPPRVCPECGHRLSE